MARNFEPGPRSANHLDFQLQLDAWFEKADGRTQKMLRGLRSIICSRSGR